MQNNDLAPVILFVYNRPSHTEKALNSLLHNKLAKDSTLFVFADGPKADADKTELLRITETRKLFHHLQGFKEIIVNEKINNEGLASSIIKGVTEIVNRFGKVIVLEDDLILSPRFLEFMNEGLQAYASSANIYSINGFMFDLQYPKRESVILPYTSTWGWATWANKWQYFSTNMEGKDYLLSNPYLAQRFNLADYSYTDMLNYKNNAWGIKWYFSVFLRNGLNVFPSQSLVHNIGFDGSGTNGGTYNPFEANVTEEKILITKSEVLDLAFFDKFVNHFKNEKLSLSKRLMEKIKRI